MYAGQDFEIQLSSEHEGFRFVKSVQEAADLIEQHSGGKNSKATALA